MIVKDERANLEHCLASVRDLVDEMIVVDTGSTDGTQSIAVQFGARLIQSGWKNDFSAARNESLAPARGGWILVLDADEMLGDRDKERVRILLAEHTPVGGGPLTAFNLIQKSPLDSGRTGIVGYQVRLFPNRPDVRYRCPVHEQIVPSLRVAGIPIIDTDVVILHTGYSNPQRNLAKQRRNLAILETQIASGVEVSAQTYFLLGGCHLDLGQIDAALGNFEHSFQVAGARPEQDDIAAGSQVRMVECLVRLRRFDEAMKLAAGIPDPMWHPEMLTARAEAESASGRAEEARASYEAILACSDRPRIPACDLVRLKIGALRFLGEYWRGHGNPARGVAVLRAAVALMHGQSGFGPAELARLYATD